MYYGGGIFAEKKTYSFENVSFKELKEQGIEFYDSAVGEKQTKPLEKVKSSGNWLQTGDSKIHDALLHTSERLSYFGFQFNSQSRTGYLAWNGSGLSMDLTEKSPKMENEGYSYIEVPVSGKGTLIVTYHLLDLKDLEKTSDNQQLAVYNQNGERQGDVKVLDFKRTNGQDEHKFKVEISEESTFARIYFSKNYKKGEQRPLGTLAIISISFKDEK